MRKKSIQSATSVLTRRLAALGLGIWALLCTPAGLPAPAGAIAEPELAGLVRAGRWLKYNGRYPYFVGLDYQHLAADPDVDIAAVLDALTGLRINKIRVWLDAYWNPDYRHPWERRDGKYDLDRWNEEYWQRLAWLAAEARTREIIVEVTLFSAYPADPAWWNNETFRPAWNRSSNWNGAFSTNSDGHFYPQFFDLAYLERSTSGKTLVDYQQALVDKALEKLGSFENVHFEIANEFPGDFKTRGFIDRSYAWQLYWARYVKQRTTRPVTVHAHDSSGPHTRGIEYFWDEPAVDILNFHFYTPSGAVRGLLHEAQARGKVLQSNESHDYRRSRNQLDVATREAWGFLTAGGYYAFYQEEALSADAIANLGRLTALRTVAETVRFWEMSPVGPWGEDYNRLVTRGPGRWQVLANPGAEYLVYLSGTPTSMPVYLLAPPGVYDYTWYDARNAAVLGRGSAASQGLLVVAAPSPRDWDGNVGASLVVQARAR